jgi:hypothetical protein
MSRVLNARCDDPNDPVSILASKLDTTYRESIAMCCATLYGQVTHTCSQHGFDCPDSLVQIGIGGPFEAPKPFWCGAAGNATYEIAFCPFCGKSLPKLENPLTITPK